MSNNWFTSDLHLGHKNILNFDKDNSFTSEEERSEVITDNIAGCVRKRDVLWILGDSVFTEERLHLLDKIRCTKKLVGGNHCAQHFDNWKLYEKFDRVYGLQKKFGCWLSHAPIHPMELRGKFNVHGHTHGVFMERPILDDFTGQVSLEKDPRYINMCIENHNYMPRDLNWIREEMEERRKLL